MLAFLCVDVLWVLKKRKSFLNFSLVILFLKTVYSVHKSLLGPQKKQKIPKDWFWSARKNRGIKPPKKIYCHSTKIVLPFHQKNGGIKPKDLRNLFSAIRPQDSDEKFYGYKHARFGENFRGISTRKNREKILV